MANLVNVDVGQLSEGLFELVEHLFPTEASRDAARFKLLQLQHEGNLAQIGVNQVEAQHESLFVSGWRPFIGWVCGFAFVYSFILQPFLVFAVWLVSTYSGVALPMETLPELDMANLMVVLGGMLGLGGMRTVEKRTGTNMNRVVTQKKSARFPSKAQASENATDANGGLY